jgi:serine/threonine protein kinase/tetratricopeptide (TPR) repeat protein
MTVDPRRLKELFLAAAELASAAERAAFLDQQCGTDAELRRRLEALLRAHDDSGGFLAAAQPDLGPTVDPAPREVGEAVGTRIGPYKLLQKLGEGGMGAVWVAEQHQPVQRRVALKVIKAGLDSARVLARFEAERQALALMDHPHIARILDAGATEQGRPYFVMELVKGMPITRFCDQERLTPRERLELFIPVCQAVQHAHQKGIIHRDLKPSNVLIVLYDGKAVPKVIDFGVAKALHQNLSERTVYTEVGQVVGTLEYMAPEQAELNNLDIDTRADVYSLGVLLYELLTGSPPLSAKQLRSAAFTEVLRLIREVEPPRPSTRLSSSAELPAIAASRKLDPAKLTKLLRGELDWIVMKCLEKERSRRYETANGLALDVGRYLADEPVLAGPPSAAYRIRKFLRKHRGPMAAAGLTVALLLAGIIGTTAGYVRAHRLQQLAEDREAEARAEKANAEAAQRQATEALAATTDDVVAQLIGSKPVLGPAERAFLERALERWQAFAAARGEGGLARSLRAEGAHRVAVLRSKLGQGEEAVQGYREAIALLEGLAKDFPAVPEYRARLSSSHNALGILLEHRGQESDAAASYRRALELQEKLVADFPAVPKYLQLLSNSHNNMGGLLKHLGKSADAEASYGRALTLQEQLVTEYTEPEYREAMARIHSNLGSLLEHVGRGSGAEAANRRALNLREKLANEYPARPAYRSALAESYDTLGVQFARLRKHTEAEAAFRRALHLRQTLADGFPAMPEYRDELAFSYGNQGSLLREVGSLPEAEDIHRLAVALRDKLATEYPNVPTYRREWAAACNRLATLLAFRGKPAEAEAVIRQALVRQEKLAAEHSAVPDYRHGLAATCTNLGNMLYDLGKGPEAEASLRQAVDVMEKLATEFPRVPEYQRDLAAAYNGLGNLLTHVGKHAAAEATFRQATAVYEKLAAEYPDVPQYLIELGVSQYNFATTLSQALQHPRALEWCDKAIATLETALRQVPADVYVRNLLSNSHVVRACCVVRAGQIGPAIREVVEWVKDADGWTVYNAACVYALASAAGTIEAGQRETYARRAVELLRQAAEQGGSNAAFLQHDEDLSSLHGRDDFKKLVAELRKQSPPRPKAPSPPAP